MARAPRLLTSTLGIAAFAVLGLGVPAYAVPSMPPAVVQPGTAPSYLTALVELRADARAMALADLDRQADAYGEELAAASELEALLKAHTKRGDSFVPPLLSYVLTSHYGEDGPLWKSGHTGEDFAAPEGAPIVAIGRGVVTEVGDAGAYGLRTIVTLENGTELWYCHQKAILVEVGAKVKPGQLIGEVGSTGNTTGPHLHLEVRPDGGAPTDPVKWLAALGVAV